MSPILYDAFLKIERAKKHIFDLNIEIIRFFDSHRHIAFIEHDPDGPGDLLKVREDYTAPTEISLTLGDAIHNLHSALDLAINDIETITKGEKTRYTKFPIYKSRQEFEAAVSGGFKEKVPFAVFDFLVTDVEPFLGGNGAGLWHLHTLDIEDKHRILLTTTHLTLISGIRVKLNNGREEEIGDWLIVPGHIAQDRLVGQRNAEITENGKPTFEIKFGKGMPFEGKPIIPTCNYLAEFVFFVVQRLAEIMEICIKYGQMT